MIDADYLSTAATAKLIRLALADAFPGVRFSVRSHVYSGGSSVDVGWTDGPASCDVDAVAGGFASRGFDGMIDMAYSIAAVVDARGRIVGHRTPGTQGSMGSFPRVDDPIPAGGRVVHFGAGYSDRYQAGVHNYNRAVASVLANRDGDPAADRFGDD